MRRLAAVLVGAWAPVWVLASEGPPARPPPDRFTVDGVSYRRLSSTFLPKGVQRQRLPIWSASYEVEEVPPPAAGPSTTSTQPARASSSEALALTTSPEPDDGPAVATRPFTAAPARPATRRTVTLGLFYFPSVDGAREMLSAPVGIATLRDIRGEVPGMDEAYGIATDGSAGSSPARLRELRGRRGPVAITATARPPSQNLAAFVAAFIASGGALASWPTLVARVVARRGPRRSAADLVPGPGGLLEGTLQLKPRGAVTLSVELGQVMKVATVDGIADGKRKPLDGALVTLALLEEKLEATTDERGRATFEIDQLSQRAALRLSLGGTPDGVERRALVRLRTGHEKDAYLDEGRIPTVTAPRDGSTSRVARQVLEFLKASFSEDRLAFPRTLNGDRPGPLDYTPAPWFTQVVAWRLAKAAGDKSTAAQMRAVLPLERLATPSGKDGAGDVFESLEAPIALALESGEADWVDAARTHLRRISPQTKIRPWTEALARASLATWRIHEITDDGATREEARSLTRSLREGIATSADPSVTGKGGAAIGASGAAAPHAWAALALFKAAQVDEDRDAASLALAQVDHLMASHVEKGTVGYSHLAPREVPGSGLDPTEGAHSEAAAATQALLLAHAATGQRRYRDGALAIRARILRSWRKEFGGFGRLEYWDGPLTPARDARRTLTPIVTRRQASIYHQPWALLSFLPGLYPYWGEGIPEDKPRWKLLDLPPLKWLRRKVQKAGGEE